MVFDPKGNDSDRQFLEDVTRQAIIDAAGILKRYRGTLKIGDKEYQFTNLGDWMSSYIDGFIANTSEIKSKMRRMSKVIRYDIVITRLALLVQQPDAKEKALDVVVELIKEILKPDEKDPDMDTLDKEMQQEYGVIKQKVLPRIFRDKLKDLDDVTQELIIDALAEHVLAEKQVALDFLKIYPELSGIIYEAGHRLKAEAPAKS